APHDRAGGHEDERALDAAREVLRLFVAEVVLAVRRLGRVGEHAERDERGHDVHHGLDRIGEQPDRAGEEIRGELEDDRHDRRRDRKPRVEGGRTLAHRAVAFSCLKMSRAPCSTTKQRNASVMRGSLRSRRTTTYHWRMTGKPFTGTTARRRNAN